MQWVITLFTHPLFLSVLATWLVAGIIKWIIGLVRKEKRSFSEQLFRTGGMPSAHSGSVATMTASVYILEGISLLFLVTALFSIIIIRDSFGVRRSVGEQAKIINKIIKHDHMHEKVKVVLGHTIFQACMGIVLGVVVAIVVHAVV